MVSRGEKRSNYILKESKSKYAKSFLNRFFYCKREGRQGWFVIQTTRCMKSTGKPNKLFIHWKVISCEHKDELRKGDDKYNWYLETFRNMKYPIVREISEKEAVLESL